MSDNNAGSQAAGAAASNAKELRDFFAAQRAKASK
jgi:hypothetical protein